MFYGRRKVSDHIGVFLGDSKYLFMFTCLYLFASPEFFTPVFELLVIKQLWWNIK